MSFDLVDIFFVTIVFGMLIYALRLTKDVMDVYQLRILELYKLSSLHYMIIIVYQWYFHQKWDRPFGINLSNTLFILKLLHFING